MRPLPALVTVLVPVVLVSAAWLANRPSAAETRILAAQPLTHAGRLALIFTGDRGATSTIRALARQLAQGGVPGIVVTPEEARDSPVTAAAAVDGMIRARLKQGGQQHLLVIGADRGAGMAPFVANRIARDLRDRVDAVVMVDLRSRVSFRPSWRDRLGGAPRTTDLPVLPELERLRGMKLLCLYQRRTRDAFCPSLDTSLARREVQPAGAGGDRDGAALARRVLEFAR